MVNVYERPSNEDKHRCPKYGTIVAGHGVQNMGCNPKARGAEQPPYQHEPDKTGHARVEPCPYRLLLKRMEEWKYEQENRSNLAIINQT